jgi:hypothetical protein
MDQRAHRLPRPGPGGVALVLAGLAAWTLAGAAPALVWPALLAAIALWGLGCFATNSAQQARLAALAPALASASIALNTSSIYAGQALGATVGGALIRGFGLAPLAPVGAAIMSPRWSCPRGSAPGRWRPSRRGRPTDDHPGRADVASATLAIQPATAGPQSASSAWEFKKSSPPLESLAEPVRRAGDRQHPPRLPGPRRRHQRAAPAQAPRRLLRALPPLALSPLARHGLPGASLRG